MAIAEDVSTPAVVSSFTSVPGTGVTTASFTPPSNGLVVVITSAERNTTSGFTVTDSGAHTWTTGVNAVGSVGGILVAVRIAYSFFTSSPGSITVTVTPDETAVDHVLAVRVVTGANSSQAGAGSASRLDTTATTNGAINITTTTVGSLVYGQALADSASTTYTVNGATTSINLYNETTFGATTSTWRASSVTGTPGVTSLGGTWGTAVTQDIAAFEVLPAGAAAATLLWRHTSSSNYRR